MRVLLTNDDGIQAEGLQALRRALAELPGLELVTIAPDGNRSAIGRGITTRAPLTVERVDFDDGTHGYQTDGTPVDCVRLMGLGLVEGWKADVVVAGINHGANLGDDVTYSGTVAAAMEGLMLGLPAVAVSQQFQRGDTTWATGNEQFDFTHSARFTARLVEGIEDVPLPPGVLINVNVPGGGEPDGVEVCRLGKRIYRDELKLDSQERGVRRFWIYGAEPSFEDDPGTDLAAVHQGRIAVTPVHMDFTHHDGIGPLSEAQLHDLLAPAVQEFEG
ncbi:MAG: 5'/3'-nucleotidase SurE [Actinomycetota bacterium]|nr:5'/3'-nucleotidase SurE [Actinomycetota bacterium]